MREIRPGRLVDLQRRDKIRRQHISRDLDTCHALQGLGDVVVRELTHILCGDGVRHDIQVTLLLDGLIYAHADARDDDLFRSGFRLARVRCSREKLYRDDPQPAARSECPHLLPVNDGESLLCQNGL